MPTTDEHGAVYIVNTGGQIHSVTLDMYRLFEANPQQYGHYRDATPDEVRRYWARQGYAYDPATGRKVRRASSLTRPSDA